jgi:hypothetical protein
MRLRDSELIYMSVSTLPRAPHRCRLQIGAHRMDSGTADAGRAGSRDCAVRRAG